MCMDGLKLSAGPTARPNARRVPELYVGDPDALPMPASTRALAAEHPPDGRRLPHADPPRNPLPDVVRERLT